MRLKTPSTLGPSLSRRPVDGRLFSRSPWECLLICMLNKQHRNNAPNNLFAYFSDIQTMVFINKLHHKNLCSQMTTLKPYQHYTRITTMVDYVSLIYHLHEGNWFNPISLNNEISMPSCLHYSHSPNTTANHQCVLSLAECIHKTPV